MRNSAKKTEMTPEACPYLHRCDKYLYLMREIDRFKESDERKSRRIRQLEAENEELKAELCGGNRSPAAIRPFGSSTPSSKIPLKPNSAEENRLRRGGLPAGHAGHGRQPVPDADADETIELPKPPECPVTHAALTSWSARTRTVIHMAPARCVKKKYTVYRAWCPHCRRYHESEVPGVMPHFMLSNGLMSQMLADHFKNGIPVGTLARRAGVKKAAIQQMTGNAAGLLEGGVNRLVDEFRAAPVKHADETPWPCDGKNGYAWGFFTPNTSLYRLRGTRSSAVPSEVFGDGPHTGVLEVDRYGGYNCSWNGRIQYCLEHLKRNIRDLIESEPENREYKKYIPKIIGLLADAMTLRSRLKGSEYAEESRNIRDKILSLVAEPVADGRLKGYFDLVKTKKDRFFQWVDHPEIEAENNLAERRLRPLVIARKTSFGSQSEEGLRRREILMSVIDTLYLRYKDPVAKLASVFDALAKDKHANVSDLLWGEA